MAKQIRSLNIRTDVHAGCDKPKSSQGIMNVVLEALQAPTDALYNLVIKPSQKSASV
ncbi:MAG: hypothetical protein WCI88_04270 [Chloroflexota bacterium]